MTVVSIDRNDSSTAGGSSLLASTTDSELLVGTNERRSRNYRARAGENPLALFAKAERTRRRRRRRQQPPTAHLRHGRLDQAVEQSLVIERAPLSNLDGAEIERLCTKHADIKELT
jgi:hypothetical protein